MPFSPTRPLRALIFFITLAFVTHASAEDADPTRKAVEGLVDALVSEGVVPAAKRDEIIRRALESSTQRSTPGTATTGDIRVQEVPEIVKDEIREQVRAELKDDVVKDIIREARTKRWGVPGAWPGWVDRLRFSGDIRLRAQSDNYASGNAVPGPPDVNRINAARSTALTPAPFLNSTEDRDRLRVRARLGLDAEISKGVDAGFRLSTGSLNDPVSTNQTLGNTDRPYQVVFDQAYLRWRGDTQAITAFGGRMPNPFLSTDLVWDADLNFDGIALRLAPKHFGDEGLVQYAFEPFVTLGAFALQEVELSSNDKWLYGGQAGFQWKAQGGTRVRFGLAYYDYENITGERNPFPGDRSLDFTAPQFVQKGNSLYEIDNDPTPGSLLLGLASDYEEANVTLAVEWTGLLPFDVMLQADYVKNIGFDSDEILARTGEVFPEETQGHQLTLGFGRAKIADRGDWQVFGTLRHLEADAVLDAFTDSDFHLGGTNAEGWIAGFSYGLRERLNLTARYLSSNEITGPPFGIDTLQIDLTGSF